MKGVLKLLQVFVFLLILILAWVSVVVFVVLQFWKNPKKDLKDIHNYRYSLFDPLKNLTKRGFLSLPEIECGDSKSYKIDDQYFIISTFDTDEFQCTGICFCNGEERRTVSTQSGNVLYFFVAALTSLVALNEAREYFSAKCVQELEGSCDSNIVSSQVDSCEPIPIEREHVTIENENYMPSPFEEEVEPSVDLRRYYCFGNCLPKKFSNLEAAELAEDFGCRNLTIDGEVEVNVSERKEKSFNHLAKVRFQVKYLTRFCKENSKGKYFYFNMRSCSGKWKVVNFCVGKNTKYVNKSIKCRQVYPVYKYEKWRST